MHERIVASDEGTEVGVRTPAAVESALTYVSEGFFGEAPESLDEKAAHLMRLIVSDHPYVDGNKRTALAAAAYLYDLNGRTLDVDDEVRTHLGRSRQRARRLTSMQAYGISASTRPRNNNTPRHIRTNSLWPTLTPTRKRRPPAGSARSGSSTVTSTNTANSSRSSHASSRDVGTASIHSTGPSPCGDDAKYAGCPEMSSRGASRRTTSRRCR